MLLRVHVHCNASQSIPSWLVTDHRVDYTETCSTPLGPSCQVGGHPAGDKDPHCPFMKGHHDTHTHTHTHTRKHILYSVLVFICNIFFIWGCFGIRISICIVHHDLYIEKVHVEQETYIRHRQHKYVHSNNLTFLLPVC